MSGTKINDYAVGDSNILAVMSTLDQAFRNNFTVDFYEKKIMAGSVIECAGSFYRFDSDEIISGSKSGTYQDNFIRLVPSGDTITAEWTTTTPTWSDGYQGYYGTTTAQTYRYIYVETGNGYFPKHLKSKSDYGVIFSGPQNAQITISTTIGQFTLATPGDGGCMRNCSISSGKILFGFGAYQKHSYYSINLKGQLSSTSKAFYLAYGVSGNVVSISPTFHDNNLNYKNEITYLCKADLFGALGTLSAHGCLVTGVIGTYTCSLDIEVVGIGDNY